MWVLVIVGSIGFEPISGPRVPAYRMRIQSSYFLMLQSGTNGAETKREDLGGIAMKSIGGFTGGVIGGITGAAISFGIRLLVPLTETEYVPEAYFRWVETGYSLGCTIGTPLGIHFITTRYQKMEGSLRGAFIGSTLGTIVWECWWYYRHFKYDSGVDPLIFGFWQGMLSVIGGMIGYHFFEEGF